MNILLVMSTCTCTHEHKSFVSLNLKFFDIYVTPAVARGRNLFGDPAAEIQELTQIIKQDIAKINADIATLQELSRTRTYWESRQVKSHSGAVVVSLQVTRRTNLIYVFVVIM